ncbi:MAG: AraC family transcriptional regulator [Crocinitomicaceae bacterium]|nr:AraC family transcriptional regulator [Crocinitomicaceae bacterium]
MVLDSKVIEFKGMPLFQKARFKTPLDMDGSFQEFACFFYMVNGKMLSYDSRGLHQLSEKDAIIKNCSNFVQRYLPTGDTDECEAIAVYLYPDLLKTIYKDEVPSFLENVGSDEQPKKLIANKLVEQYMSSLLVYFEDPEVVDEELGILKLKELMMILLKSENHQNIRKLLSEIFTPVNVRFKKAVEQNIFNQLSIDQLAFICNMSLSSFKREFQKVFGDTPARFIKNRRLEHAASRLVCSDLSSTDVAYESGFQDPTTFSASFNQKYNVSPKKFRLDKMSN